MSDSASVWTQRLAEFRAATAARQPTPGCGAAGAVTADIGLALVLKGLRISEAHGSDPVRHELLQAAEALLGRPGAFADDDMQAFDDYLSAARHGEVENKQAAARQACAVPLALAHCCLEALELAVDAWPRTDPIVQSDVHAGAVLIHAGLSAALINVDADMTSLEDPSAQDQAGRTRRRLQSEGDALLRRLVDSGK
ncbi:cyclodeaminase/cyclohydrolase family protein [Stutzerimonas xanthomarina]|uniref:Formiminotetrahydrofolate cyclodeaminase n=2 Tax=Stutzerimonas xanthomarina TaxID=271420 RepID=A0A1M5T4H1_9GAMM|nr:cyclodeaminase/cyclohydrolase family protein [Stutzerimonas xanthomarina]MCP9339965.1 cyclodeaminase/cyclohydrolase family protein [Stutzerimonas xanthomarina]SEH59422.1 Formiminotetrahydrofolate cyclodeaminase [Stutzerimonas xanthomarina]SHH45582.1 Formiminotetrahydrofolate cyclodeaminase [Stutzerimonas xanthomarina DSM 18231]